MSKRISEEITTENFQISGRTKNINIQAQQIPSKMNSETHSETHYNQTFKEKDKESWKQKREANHHLQEILNKIWADVSSETPGGHQTSDWICQSVKEKYYQPRKPKCLKIVLPEREREPSIIITSL